jgi:hypothetical protein
MTARRTTRKTAASGTLVVLITVLIVNQKMRLPNSLTDPPPPLPRLQLGWTKLFTPPERRFLACDCGDRGTSRDHARNT